jgi:hypothetical protein
MTTLPTRLTADRCTDGRNEIYPTMAYMYPVLDVAVVYVCRRDRQGRTDGCVENVVGL